MHPDVEKLISIAKESGELTGKQREIILRKVRQLGEDVDEVEMVLESIRPKTIIEESTRGSEKRMKCPNCGSFILDTAFYCPECGYALDKENFSSSSARNQISKLQNILSETSNPEKQALLINTFTMPSTKEGLLQLLELSYSNYSAIGTDAEDAKREPIRNAWRGKCLHACSALERIGKEDPAIQNIVNHYRSLLEKESKKRTAYSKKRRQGFWASYGAAIGVGGICLFGSILPLFFGIKSDNSSLDQVEVCIQNHDYQGAKAAAQKYSGDTNKLLDDISVQEVSYLISIGNIKHAKVVAAGIGDDQKRYNVLKAISDVEYDKGNSQLLQPNVDHDPVLDTPHVDKNQENNTLNSEENNQVNTEEEVSDNMAYSDTPAGLDNVTSTSETMPNQRNETVTKGSVSVTAPNWVQVGERFSVAFSSEDKVSDFEFTNPDGILLVWGPQKSTSTSSVEGNSVTVTTYTFVLSAQTPGIYSLPAKAKSHDHDVQFPKISVEVVK